MSFKQRVLLLYYEAGVEGRARQYKNGKNNFPGLTSGMATEGPASRRAGAAVLSLESRCYSIAAGRQRPSLVAENSVVRCSENLLRYRGRATRF